jgi:hypothetical protein
MTTPPAADPAPPLPAPPSGPPAPLPAPGPPAAPPPAAPPPASQSIANLEEALERERSKTREFERQLALLKQSQMTDQEKALAAAKDEGRKEAAKAAGVTLAAAEFRALAAGKLADPGRILGDGDLNLARYVDDQGNVDRKALEKLVERLAAAAAPVNAGGPGVPAGPRGAGQPGDSDFLRSAMRGGPKGW